MKKAKPKYAGIEFDSMDEIYAYQFLEICKKEKYIKDFVFHPESFSIFHEVSEPVVVEKVLKKSVRMETRKNVIFKPLTYTPDFIIDTIYLKVLKDLFRDMGNNKYMIDVKPPINVRFGDAKYFSILQKTMFHVHGIYINKFVCEDIFNKIFAPETFKTTKTGKVRVKYQDYKTIEEFKKEMKSWK